MTMVSARERVLAAIDVAALDPALDLIAQLRPYVGGFKVGLELCNAAGVPQVVQAVAQAGGRLFLDLKLHDIPNTVAGAVGAIGALGPAVHMLTIHTQGGAAMMRAAAEAAAAFGEQRPLLLGVTVLTSIDQAALRAELGVAAPLADHVTRLAQLARDCGLDGVVCSPHEAAAVRRPLGSSEAGV
ncbi:MAG: orotidine-5'-phosphate decarboxylase [Oscillochloris sp.]|nr:orotidine-5'-phosphate decarboxylase [Oscillochloris sp.]